MIVSKILDCCDPDWIAHQWEGSDGCSAVINRDRAKFSLEGTSGPLVVLDLDKALCISQRRRCDYVMVVDDNSTDTSKVVLIELTSGKKDSKTLKTQLEESAKIAAQKAGSAQNITFHPVCVG